MAKDLAREVGYIYVDSGAMYRAVTLWALRQNYFNGNEINTEALKKDMLNISITFRLNADTRLPETYLNDENVEKEIRSLEVSSRVSPIATLPFVREALTRWQQQLGAEKGIVMDGRDIGTAVFPEAELKIFVTASAEVRAQRRYDELKAKGMEAAYEDILQNVKERDYIDSHRAMNPLRQAEDAIVLDNSELTIAEQKQWLLDKFHATIQQS